MSASNGRPKSEPLKSEVVDGIEPWIPTVSGRKFVLDRPTVESINVLDIAYGLSHVARFAGQTRKLYTVAQHSVFVSRELERRGFSHFAFEGLMHDASEAYTGDVTSPMKVVLGDVFRGIETRLMACIAARFRLVWPFPEILHVVDHLLLVTEAMQLQKRPPIDNWTQKFGEPISSLVIDPWHPDEARRRFLERFAELDR